MNTDDLLKSLRKHAVRGSMIEAKDPGRTTINAGIDLAAVIEDLNGQPEELLLRGKATDNIWLQGDGEEPHVIGMRLDCGDSGAVFLTREQAKILGEQLLRSAAL